MANAIEYGVDFRSTLSPNGVIDLDPYFAEVDNAESVAWSTLRRCFTHTGSMSWATDEGVDIRDSLEDAIDRAKLAALRITLRAEVMRDDRIASATVAMTFDDATSTLSISISAVLSSGSSFRLVLSAGGARVVLKSLTTASS